MTMPTDAELDRRAAAINAAAIADQQAIFRREYPDLAAKLNGSAPTNTGSAKVTAPKPPQAKAPTKKRPAAAKEELDAWELGSPGSQRRRRC